MYKLFVLAALLAVAVAKPGVLSPWAYSAPIATPWAAAPWSAPLLNTWNSGLAYASPYAYSAAYGYSAPLLKTAAVAPIAYSAPVVKTIAAPIAAPLVKAAPAIVPAPVAYSTGVKVALAAEPVEQHGYKIAY